MADHMNSGSSSNVMLQIIINKLKSQAEEVIVEELFRFRAKGRPQDRYHTTKSYGNSTFNISKIYSIDFKKAFDRL